jgi:xylulokinase
MTLNHSGGLLLRWFRDAFCLEEISAARSSGVDAYDLMVADASAGPTGLYVLPHFAGSGTPTFDTDSKGAFLGMTFATRKADLAKAILEGLTYELRVNLDLMRSAGVVIDSLRAIGGGAKSDLWLQLKADITGIPVLRPRITEAAAWGAAVLAGHGAGLFPDIAGAVDRRLVLEKRYDPEPRSVERYQKSFAVYTQIYPALAPLLHQMH